MPKRAMAGCVITPVGQHTSWDRDKQVNKLPRWLSHLSGQHRSTFSPATTHLVVSTKQWRAQPQNNVIKRALELNAEGGNIHILTFDWLEDSLNAQTKKREGPYSWEKLDAGVRKLEEKATKAREKEAAKEAKSVPGILAEVFEESTSPFVNPVEKKKVEQKLAKDKELQESQQAEAKEAEKLRRKQDQARIFRKGSEKARNHLLSDNHHIYVDATGFKFDVLITKVDYRHNYNERWALTIYESDTEPYTYAANAQFSGTKKTATNNVVAVLGSPFLTAMNRFKCGFLEYTGVEWDERISAHFMRERQAKAAREAGLPAPGSELPFDERLFEYRPPAYGPQGSLSEKEKETLVGMGVKLSGGWTSKDSGAAESPDKRVDSPLAANKNIEQADISAYYNEKDYPFATDQQQAATGQQNVTDQDITEQDIMNAIASTETAGPGLNEQRVDGGHDDDNHDNQDRVHGEQVNGDGNDLGDLADFDFGPDVDISSFLNDDATQQNGTSNVVDETQQDSNVHADAGGAEDVYEQSLPWENRTQRKFTPTTPNFDNTQELVDMQVFGETQAAEKAGNDFFNEFVNGDSHFDEAHADSAKTAEELFSNGVEGAGGAEIAETQPALPTAASFNLGSSILGKRKAEVVVESEQDVEKEPEKATSPKVGANGADHEEGMDWVA